MNSGKTTLTLDFGANYAGHTVKALLTLNKTVGTEKTKTLSAGETAAISSQATIESGTIGSVSYTHLTLPTKVRV